jgi:Protein of unknown function (DUF2510)
VTESGGWYPDPNGAPGRLRWWDGTQWTDRTRAELGELSGQPDRPRRNWAPLAISGTVALAVLLIIVIALVGGGPASQDQANPRAGSPLPTALPTEPPVTVAPCDTTASPSLAPGTPNPSPPAVRGARVSDSQAGISYAGQGEPWRKWDQTWITPGLQTRFATGYYIITQADTPSGQYYATVLSGAVTARVGDGPPADPRCVAEQVADDVRQAYYPQPNVRDTLEAHAVTVSGHPGYLIRYHLKFSVTGFKATGEQVGIMVVNVGRPQLAVLYLSIPDTVSNYNYLFPQVFNSVQAP